MSDKAKKGESFICTVIPVTQVRIDSDAVRALLSDEDLKKVEKPTSFTQKKLTRVEGEEGTYWEKPDKNTMANMTLTRAIDELGVMREKKSQIEKGEKFWSGVVDGFLRVDAEESKGEDKP